MKSERWLLTFLIACSISMSFVVSPLPGKLKKAFEALRVYNYFDAKDLFYKSLKNDSTAAAFGLSTIYSRNDNPFYNLDSALKFIDIADRNYSEVDPKDLAEYKELGVDSASIQNKVLFIDSLFFEKAEEAGTITAYQDFISGHESQPYLGLAIAQRNSLAYKEAQELGTSQAFKEFLTNYPESEQADEASRKYQRKLYEENTADNEVESYRRFIDTFPDSPYLEDAQFQVYQIYTSVGSPESYLLFIEENPENPNIEKAWRTIYALEVKELSARSIAAFTLKYPDYPFMEELKIDFDFATTRYYPIEREEKWGFIDEEGEVRIEPQFDWVEPFEEGAAVVGIEDSVKFVDKAGNYLTNRSFDDALAFQSGYAIVELDGLYGAINRLGNWVIEPKYDELGEFSDGFFYAGLDEGYGFLNEKGEVAIDFEFDDATDFKNGLAIVSLKGSQGLIDRFGEPVGGFNYDWIEPFHDDRRPSRVRKSGKYGLIDQVGTLLVDTVYDIIGDFHEGLALTAEKGKYGYLNLAGDTAIDFLYTYSQDVLDASAFRNGHAVVYQKDKVGMIDSTGAKVFPAIFEAIGYYNPPLIPVKKRDKWGYSDMKVNLAIPYNFDHAESFIANVAIAGRNGLKGIIDTTGAWIIPAEFESILRLDSLYLVKDTAFGIINIQGEEILPKIYESAEPIDDYVVKLKRMEEGVDYFDFRRRQLIWRSED